MTPDPDRAARTPQPENPLEATLTTAVAERLGRDWFVIGMAGDQALKPIAGFLHQTFEIENTTGIAVIVVRRHD